MPNHVDHDCFISGPTEDVTKLLETCLKDDGSLDANVLIPYPRRFREMDDAYKAWEEEQREKEGPMPWDQAPKNGYNSGGYEWCIDNWGTKWGTYDGNGVEELPSKRRGRRRVQLGFYTAWSPALPLYAALAKRFPTCDIRIMYYESGMAFKGKLVYKNGKCTLNTSSNYRGSRGG